MNYLTLKHISKAYGDKAIFSDVELYINKGDKAGLIARNGSGKTSLLRIITNEESPDGDTGVMRLHPDIQLGYLRQDIQLPPDEIVLDYLYAHGNEKIKTLGAYEAMVQNPDHDRAALQKLADRIDHFKAWDEESKLREILHKLDIDNPQMTIGHLSGGQQKRLALAQLLIDEPDFLILDEPTNHLDIKMIEWLEDRLSQPNLTLLLITHDRYFLDNICDYIFELDNGQVQKFSGSYSQYLDKKAGMQHSEQRRFEKSKKLYKSELQWIRRQPKARGTKAKSRIDKFYQVKNEIYGHNEEEELTLHIKPQRLGGKILECQYISKSFGDITITKDFHYKFSKKDRVGIIGPNGSGKTTFINMLTHREKPDKGNVVIGETVKFGYYTQDGLPSMVDKKIIDVVRDIAEFIPMEKGKKLTAEQLLENFMFSPSQQQVYISRLSGGEKRRLHLLTILMQNPNFLILDEPTNDLDIHTLQVLEKYLIDFPGVLIVVSHDRFFMDKIVDHLFVFDGQGQVKDFPGNYADYKNRPQDPTPHSVDEKESPPSVSTYEERKKRKNKLRSIERKLDELEGEKITMNQQFLGGALSQEETIALSQRLDAINEEISSLEEDWMSLAEKVEEAS